jgi:hypothetical protein
MVADVHGLGSMTLEPAGLVHNTVPSVTILNHSARTSVHMNWHDIHRLPLREDLVIEVLMSPRVSISFLGLLNTTPSKVPSVVHHDWEFRFLEISSRRAEDTRKGMLFA